MSSSLTWTYCSSYIPIEAVYPSSCPFSIGTSLLTLTISSSSLSFSLMIPYCLRFPRYTYAPTVSAFWMSRLRFLSSLVPWFPCDKRFTCSTFTGTSSIFVSFSLVCEPPSSSWSSSSSLDASSKCCISPICSFCLASPFFLALSSLTSSVKLQTGSRPS